jgi:6,7-dimethyl-8-ribityllumazine synthase
MQSSPPSRDASDSPARRLPPGARIAAVVSTYHGELTGAMRDAARRELEVCGLAERDFLALEAPGAFELPIVARRLALRDDVSAVLAIGLVLKGETRHDEYIAAAVAEALQRVALETDKPVLFGVLTCDTYEQARARALPASEGGTHDKGREVARAAVHALAALEAARTIGGRETPVGFARRRVREEDVP